jgi:uncharacterized protein (DUF58 family)
VRTEVVLRVLNRARRPVRLEIHDHHPASLEAEGLPRAAALAAGGWTELRYQVRPVARGEARFGRAEARVVSPLALWQARRRAGEEAPVRVYPNFQALARYTLLATDNRLSQIGVLQVRRRGEGTEFHQLREYRQGDPQRAIDWKATARTARLIAREYEEDKDQRVLLVIDCGRRMASKDAELSHFDHTLNAALLLGHVALRQGDAVGMITMGGVQRYLEPRKSVAAVHAMLNRVYDLEPTLAVPDYDLAASEVMRHMRRRALVILLTNLRDEDDETLLPGAAPAPHAPPGRARLAARGDPRPGALGASRQLRSRGDPRRRGRLPGAARAGLPARQRHRGHDPRRRAGAAPDRPGEPVPGAEAGRVGFESTEEGFESPGFRGFPL